MEYADFGSLKNYLKENFNILDWNDKYNLAYQLACAVFCLHYEGIVHRNLVITLLIRNKKLILLYLLIYMYINIILYIRA